MNLYSLLIILTAAIVTIIIRFLPFLFFRLSSSPVGLLLKLYYTKLNFKPLNILSE